MIDDEGSSYGTDPNSNMAANALKVSDLSITPQVSDVVSRNLIRPFYGASQQLLANKRVECSFTVEMTNSGTATAAPAFDKALQACGLSRATDEDSGSTIGYTYKPESSSFNSVTIYYNVDGVLHKVTGARGTFSLSATVGEIPTITFNFTGIYVPPIDAAAPTTNLAFVASADPLLFNNDNLTGSFNAFGSTTRNIQSVSLDLGNSIVYRETIGSSNAKEVLITDRAVTGTVVLQAPDDITDKDYFAEAAADATALSTLDFTHGTATGNKVQINSTKADIGDITYEDSDGIAMMSIPFTLVPESDGNELSMIFR